MLIEASNWEKELICPKISKKNTNKHANICCDFHNTLEKVSRILNHKNEENGKILIISS